MEGMMMRLKHMLPDVYRQAKLNRDDFLAILQGITAFASSRIGGDPFVAIDGALGAIANLADAECLGELDKMKEKLKKWLTFGQNYTPLLDSSDLNFSQMDVDSVPEVMQVTPNLGRDPYKGQNFRLSNRTVFSISKGQ